MTRISRSTSVENFAKAEDEEPKVTKGRGRRSKYSTDEERKEVRRQQQREYRLRKKQEVENLRKENELLRKRS